MIEHRPSSAYLLLFFLALMAWVLADPLQWPFALLAMILSSSAYFWHKTIFRPALLWILLGSGFFMAMAYFLLYVDQSESYISIYSLRFVHSAALTLATLIVFQWFSWRSEQFDWLLFSIGLFLVSSGVSWQTLQHKPVYIWIVLSFVGALLLFRLFPRFQTHHHRLENSELNHLKQYYLRTSMVLAIFLGATILSIHAYEDLEQKFNALMSDFLSNQDSSWSGFSGQTFLSGNQEIKLSQKVAFYVETPIALDYWRGNILTHYRDGYWYPQETLVAPGVSPLTATTNDSEGLRAYTLAQKQSPDERLIRAHVQMNDHYNGILFTPGETRQVILPAQTRVYQNQYQLLRRELNLPKHSFDILVAPGQHIPAYYTAEIMDENLLISEDLKQSFKPLARAIVGQTEAPLGMAHKIESWFQENFTYSLHTGTITPGVDPTLDFVLNRRPAWCSWYASGMILMLRSLDIPAHMVSGWRSMDYNILTRSWVVKEKEAHDWVEVLDLERGVWVRFDPTPPGQLAELTGSGKKSSWLSQISDGLIRIINQGKDKLGALNIQNSLEALRNGAIFLLKNPVFYLAFVLLLLLNRIIKNRHNAELQTDLLNGLEYSKLRPSLQANLLLLKSWSQSLNLADPCFPLDQWLNSVAGSLSQGQCDLLSGIVSKLRRQRYGPCTDAEDALIKAEVEQALTSLFALSNLRKYTGKPVN